MKSRSDIQPNAVGAKPIALLPCPFCGRAVDDDLDDTLYPSGIYWREEDGIRHYVRHQERRLTDMRCWLMNCPDSSGGCGAEITADSAAEVIAAWNRRAPSPEGVGLTRDALAVLQHIRRCVRYEQSMRQSVVIIHEGSATMADIDRVLDAAVGQGPSEPEGGG